MCLLQSTKSCILGAQIYFDVLSNLSHQTLEGKFSNQVSGLLMTYRVHSTRPVKMRFLHSSSSGRSLASGFCSHLHPPWFTTCGFASNWLCRSHGIQTSLLFPSPTGAWELEAALALEIYGSTEEAVNTTERWQTPSYPPTCAMCQPITHNGGKAQVCPWPLRWLLLTLSVDIKSLCMCVCTRVCVHVCVRMCWEEIVK